MGIVRGIVRLSDRTWAGLIFTIGGDERHIGNISKHDGKFYGITGR